MEIVEAIKKPMTLYLPGNKCGATSAGRHEVQCFSPSPRWPSIFSISTCSNVLFCLQRPDYSRTESCCFSIIRCLLTVDPFQLPVSTHFAYTWASQPANLSTGGFTAPFPSLASSNLSPLPLTFSGHSSLFLVFVDSCQKNLNIYSSGRVPIFTQLGFRTVTNVRNRLETHKIQSKS